MILRKNVLLTAFQGTSSEKLVEAFDTRWDRLILPNDRIKSVDRLFQTMDSNEYRFVISFGQKPVIRDKIYIEVCGQINDTALQTTFDVPSLVDAISSNGIPVKLSFNAGTSFCNHLYAHGLQHLTQNAASAKMVFIHIPLRKNISDFNNFSQKLQSAVDHFSQTQP